MNDSAMIDDSSKTRGLRLKRIRKMMGLSTEELAQLLGYSRQTISYWENATHRGLSKKGADKLIAAAKQHGIECDEKWMLYGIGEVKMSVSSLQGQPSAFHWMKKNIEILHTNIKFFKDIESFLLNNPTAAVSEISDLSMYPLYMPGDWVGGYLADIDSNISGKICIVEFDQRCQVRVVQQGDTDKKFNLCWLHKTQENEGAFELKNVELKKAAPITQLWRK